MPPHKRLEMTMNVFHRYAKPIPRALIVAMIALSAAQYPAEAASVSIGSPIGPPAGAESDRRRLRELTNREDVRAKMEAYGIDSDEAFARVDSLSDREIADIAGAPPPPRRPRKDDHMYHPSMKVSTGLGFGLPPLFHAAH